MLTMPDTLQVLVYDVTGAELTTSGVFLTGHSVYDFPGAHSMTINFVTDTANRNAEWLADSGWNLEYKFTGCPLGFFLLTDFNTGEITCTPCAAGSTSLSLDSAECSACPVQTYNNDTSGGDFTCAPCPAGSFQDKPGQVACQTCLSSNYQGLGCAHSPYTTVAENWLVYSLLAVTTGTMLFAVVGFYKFRRTKAIQAGIPEKSILILFGAVLLLVSAMLNAVSQTVQTCSAKLWFGYIGGLVVLFPVVVKLWRLHKIFMNPSLSIVRFSGLKTSLLLLVLLLVQVTAILLSNFYKPIIVEQGICISQSFLLLGVGFGSCFTVAVLLICGLSYKLKHIPNNYNPCVWTIVLCALLLSLFFALARVSSLPDVTLGYGHRRAVVSVVVLLCVLSVIVCDFGPSFLKIKRQGWKAAQLEHFASKRKQAKAKLLKSRMTTMSSRVSSVVKSKSQVAPLSPTHSIADVHVSAAETKQKEDRQIAINETEQQVQRLYQKLVKKRVLLKDTREIVGKIELAMVEAQTDLDYMMQLAPEPTFEVVEVTRMSA
jgi:hypothetical protein